jgi:hypothetical protein
MFPGACERPQVPPFFDNSDSRNAKGGGIRSCRGAGVNDHTTPGWREGFVARVPILMLDNATQELHNPSSEDG